MTSSAGKKRGRSAGALVLVSKLNLQRRIHPELADLMRATLYLFLQDHLTTARLPVAGMAHRTLRLDHQEPADIPDQLAVGGRSSSDSFECAMILELARHLLSTNGSNSGDIGSAHAAKEKDLGGTVGVQGVLHVGDPVGDIALSYSNHISIKRLLCLPSPPIISSCIAMSVSERSPLLHVTTLANSSFCPLPGLCVSAACCRCKRGHRW